MFRCKCPGGTRCAVCAFASSASDICTGRVLQPVRDQVERADQENPVRLVQDLWERAHRDLSANRVEASALALALELVKA